MMDESVKQQNPAHPKRVPAKTLALALLIVLGLACVVALGRFLENRRTRLDASVEEERLYITGGMVKRLSLSFNGLAADWYWLRSLQYVGRKSLKHESFRLDNLSALDLKLLYPLLDTATTLDPQFMAVYEYGAIVLPTVSDTDADEDAIALLKKGIEEEKKGTFINANGWRLYHHLGYIYWQRGDYQAASSTYAEGAKRPGAPNWMQAMSARMAAEGNSRSTAREIYQRMYEQSDDEQVRQMIATRLLQLDSLDERDAIRKVLNDYAARVGHCASSWREVAPLLARVPQLRLNTAGTPLDPTNVPYVLVKDGCDLDLSDDSKIPRK
jgi:tetratricopeptide (TPR) repeat protein